MTHQYQLALIIGSVRAGRVGPTVAGWFRHQAEQHGGAQLDVIDLADLDLPADLDGGGDTAMFGKRIEAADAVVVVTPEYNHGYPGALKTAIDSAYEQWRAKPVGFVAYGGISGGLRAVEQLRPVFAELHAVTVRASVSFHHVHDQVVSGELCPSARAASAAAKLLTELGWWARALRHARAAEAYEPAE